MTIDSLKNYAQEKVERVNKYLDKATEAHVVLSIDRHLHQADITIQSGRFVLRGVELTRPTIVLAQRPDGAGRFFGATAAMHSRWLEG